MKNVYAEIFLLSTMSILSRTLASTNMYTNFRPTPDSILSEPMDNNFDEIYETARREIYPSTQFGSYFHQTLSVKLQGPTTIRLHCLRQNWFRFNLNPPNGYTDVYCVKNQNSLKNVLYYTLPNMGLKGDPTNAWNAGFMILRAIGSVPICAVHCATGTRPTVLLGSYYSSMPQSYFTLGCANSVDATCTAVCSDDVFEIEKGKVHCTLSTQVGTVCTAQCDAGYTSVGADFKTCESTQKWNSVEPFRCLASDVGNAVKYFRKKDNLSVDAALEQLRNMLESHLSDTRRTSPTTRRDNDDSEKILIELELNGIMENLLAKLSEFIPITLKHYQPSCSVSPKERIECGWGGITPEECKNRRCCWDSSRRDTKWCFHRADGLTPTNSFGKTTRRPQPSTTFPHLFHGSSIVTPSHDVHPQFSIQNPGVPSSQYSECGCVNTQVSARCLETPTKRIFCGKMSLAETWPWHAIVHHGEKLCGGTLISKNFVLTAAHCLKLSAGDFDSDPSNEIYLGVSRRDNMLLNPSVQKRGIKRVIRHPLFHSRGDNFIQNDIALIQLSSPVQYSETVRKLCLPGANTLTLPKTCYITGFGKTDSKTDASLSLQSAEMPLMSTSQCQSFYHDRVNPIQNICAGDAQPSSPDACKGDSGGPLVCQAKEGDSCSWYLAGVTSFGKEPCGEGWPGVYVNVSHYESWILSHFSSHRD